MRKKCLISVIILFCCTTSAAFGYVMGTTNFGFSGYPGFESKVSRKPVTPHNRDRFYVDNYRQEVQEYVREGKAYIEAANNDIERIRAAIKECRTEIDRAVIEYENLIGW